MSSRKVLLKAVRGACSFQPEDTASVRKLRAYSDVGPSPCCSPEPSEEGGVGKRRGLTSFPDCRGPIQRLSFNHSDLSLVLLLTWSLTHKSRVFEAGVDAPDAAGPRKRLPPSRLSAALL
ncbi:hypothetical protein J4Q44_G00306100 [Coregonus suidteri]|uniref:Uncharacterized protein n=1 Tax=Coregonus suidteri TaxID=861788 RepID=A0AAN8L0Y1_9TELE